MLWGFKFLNIEHNHDTDQIVLEKRMVKYQDQDSLLVKRRNDNQSPGPVIRELVPSSHRRSDLATQSSASSEYEIRESERAYQSLIVWGKKLPL